MMMDRCHLKDPFPMCSLKIGDLQNIRNCLQHINKSNDWNKQGHLGHICHPRHKTAECKRTRITHKNLGRIHIKQQKAEQSARNRAGDRRKTIRHPNTHNRKERSYHDCHTAGKSIQTICQIRSVYGCYHNKIQRRNRKYAEFQIVPCPKRDLHIKPDIRIPHDIKYEDARHNDLPKHFLPCF